MVFIEIVCLTCIVLLTKALSFLFNKTFIEEGNTMTKFWIAVIFVVGVLEFGVVLTATDIVAHSRTTPTTWQERCQADGQDSVICRLQAEGRRPTKAAINGKCQ